MDIREKALTIHGNGHDGDSEKRVEKLRPGRGEAEEEREIYSIRNYVEASFDSGGVILGRLGRPA